MLHLEGKNGVKTCDGLTRRDFLRAGAAGAGAVGLTLADLAKLRAAGSRDLNCILLFLVGGPSQLDTWDLKPDAPGDVRGPFRPIRTNVPGVEICEHFPRMARLAHRYAIVRSVHHDSAPIHETGHQLMQTGRLARNGVEHPHYGAVLSHLRGPRAEGVPASVVLPAPIGHTGVSISHGQTGGYLGARHEPFVVCGDLDPARLPSPKALVQAVDGAHRQINAAEGLADPAIEQVFSAQAKKAFDLSSERDDLMARYGRNTFGQSCLLARRLVEAGVRLVTVNMFDTVFNAMTWDCHADGGALPVRLDDYRDVLCPMFDAAYATLVEDLAQRGLLDTTLVLATGEFGRTPHLNPRGGRDHWPGCWSVLFAGAGIRGGRIVGASDRLGAEPSDRPVKPADVAATVYRALGLDPKATLPGPDGKPIPLADAAPVEELFRG
jgi:uncharacterized protein (DUF1501 family)